MKYNSEIAVSIVCITYNQKNYIGKMLESLLNQNTKFKYEILVHDDASDDGTQEIILEYQKKYPDKIKAILQSENQYSQGINPNIEFNYPRVRGKYIAYCEGDDYWNDSSKLQMQFEVMENHNECSICVHMTQCVSPTNRILDRKFPPISLAEGVITPKQYIKLEFCDTGWLFQTSSFFIRTSIIKKYIKEYHDEYPVGDLPLVLFSLLNGNCYYIPKIMSCYRVNAGGIMSSLKNGSRRRAFYNKMIEGHRNFDKISKNIYHDMFNFAIANCEIEILMSQKKYKDICKRKYRSNRKKMSLRRKILVYFGAVFPNLASWFERLKNGYTID